MNPETAFPADGESHPQGQRFSTTNYKYKVDLGRVQDRKCLTWSVSFEATDFEDAVRLAELWREHCDGDHVTEITAVYREYNRGGSE